VTGGKGREKKGAVHGEKEKGRSEELSHLGYIVKKEMLTCIRKEGRVDE